MGAADRAATIESLRALMTGVGPPVRVAEPSAPPDEPALDEPGEVDFDAAKRIALRRLNARSRTSAELRADLVGRGAPAGVADAVVARFEAVGLLDDAAYARDWIESRQRSKSLSAARLRRELLGKGIAEPVIADALAATVDEADIALAYARKRLGLMAGVERDVARRRLAGQLARRGFSQAVVMRTVRRVVDEREGSLAGD
ncbi:MAG: recombination regulator RecX [Propionibacteriaceae bacterium]|jgi:regulatory protein|nr:recombination regulator RecX [Propionibacteriaceae bacterium]